VVKEIDFEIVLPCRSTVPFDMLKDELMARGVVLFFWKIMKLKMLLKARSNFDPPSLPSVVTFQLYEVLVRESGFC
jgi:hypothetical protein